MQSGVNKAYIDDKQMKAILTYISGIKHAEQIRMMFFCSNMGMRSINFVYLQVKDVYTDDLKVKDMICLEGNKNKGKYSCIYRLNNQTQKEFTEYMKYLKKHNSNLNPETYLFTSQKQNKPFVRSSISRLFASIYKKFGIHAASHMGRHMFICKLVNSGVNICLVKELANHQSITTTHKYFISTPQMLANAVENVKI